MNNWTEDNNTLLCCLDCRAKMYALAVSVTKIMLTQFVLQAQGGTSPQGSCVPVRAQSSLVDRLLYKQCIMIMSVTVLLDEVFCDGFSEFWMNKSRNKVFRNKVYSTCYSIFLKSAYYGNNMLYKDILKCKINVMFADTTACYLKWNENI